MPREVETPPTPTSDDFVPNLDPNVNKTEATQQLIAAWTRAGKSTRSNVDLVAELNRRYPKAHFTTTNVAQAKQRLKFLDAEADKAADQAPTSPDQPPPHAATGPNAGEPETEFLRQLRHLVHLLGREGAKRLIDSL